MTTETPSDETSDNNKKPDTVAVNENAVPTPEASVDQNKPSAADINESDAEEDEVQDLPAFKYMPSATVTMTYDFRTPFPKSFKLDTEQALPFVAATNAEIDRMITERPLDSLGTSDKVLDWARAVGMGQTHLMREDAFAGSIAREGSQWMQSIKSESTALHAGRPRIESDDNNGELLTGMAARVRMQTLLGLGSPVRIPLWHSGMWVVLKTPTEASLLELDRRIAAEKILLGRVTNGLVFSSASVYTTRLLVDFALQHVQDATIRFTNPLELKKTLLAPDIPSLIWGVMLSVYPGGYPYQQPCTKDPRKCNHIVEEMLNVGKLQWTDDRALTEYQRKHMQRRNSKFTEDELKRYRAEHGYHTKSTVELTENLFMDLQVPTLEQSEQQGIEWVDQSVEAVDRSLSGEVSASDRNQYILNQAHVTSLNQYAHWIKRLTLKFSDDDTKYIEDRESIAENLNMLVSSEQISDAFIEGMKRFIDNTTISLIAVPRIDCPACGSPMGEEYRAHPTLVPMDVTTAFFTILTQRTSKVLSRSMM